MKLLSFHFQQSKSDFSLFTKLEGDSFTAILIYVDDLLISGSHMHFIQATKQFLSTQFRMKDLGELRYSIGIKVDRTKEGFFLSQKKYLTDVLKQYNMTHCKPLKVPMSPHVKLTADLGDPLPDASVYQQLIRKLIYLTLTRPDIAFSMHLLSQFMHKPTCVHLQAAKRVLKYL